MRCKGAPPAGGAIWTRHQKIRGAGRCAAAAHVAAQTPFHECASQLRLPVERASAARCERRTGALPLRCALTCDPRHEPLAADPAAARKIPPCRSTETNTRGSPGPSSARAELGQGRHFDACNRWFAASCLISCAIMSVSDRACLQARGVRFDTHHSARESNSSSSSPSLRLAPFAIARGISSHQLPTHACSPCNSDAAAVRAPPHTRCARRSSERAPRSGRAPRRSPPRARAPRRGGGRGRWRQPFCAAAAAAANGGHPRAAAAGRRRGVRRVCSRQALAGAAAAVGGLREAARRHRALRRRRRAPRRARVRLGHPGAAARGGGRALPRIAGIAGAARTAIPPHAYTNAQPAHSNGPHSNSNPTRRTGDRRRSRRRPTRRARRPRSRC